MTVWDPDPEHWGADTFEDPIANAEAEDYRERPDPRDYEDLDPNYRPPPPPDKLRQREVPPGAPPHTARPGGDGGSA